MKTAVEAQRAPISSSTLQYCIWEKPRPPTSFGAVMPSTPTRPEAVDHVARDVGLAIDLLRIEVFVEKGAQLRDGAIDVGLLRVGEPGIGHGPVGHEVSEEKPLGEAKFLPPAEEQFFGLLNFLLSLNVGFAKCHRWKPPANGRRATHCSKARPIVHPTAADQAPNRLTNS